MSKTRGEGRAPNEKGGRIVGGKTRKERLAEELREEQEWAKKSGPVVTRQKEVKGEVRSSGEVPRSP